MSLKMRLTRATAGIVVLAVLASLAGCGASSEAELTQWMEQVKRETKVNIPKLSEPKKFVPFAYTQKDATDPFNQTKLTAAIARAQANANSKFAPDPTRPHQPLESYPLDTITMVGAIKDRTGAQHAILQVDKTVYDVRVGDYLGQNDGRITAITETEVSITERAQDAGGEWGERQATLDLQENRK